MRSPVSTNGGTEVFTPLDSFAGLYEDAAVWPLTTGIGLDNLQHDGGRQVDADRIAFHQIDGHVHVVLQEGCGVAQQVAGDMGLLVALGIHQHEVGAVGVGVGELLLLGHQTFYRIGGAPALVCLVA